MTTRRLLGRRPSTPLRASVSSRPGQSLPNDVVCQTCGRVAIVGLVFAALWVLTIFTNTIVAGWFGEMAFMRDLWPFPGHLIAAIGIVSSLSITVLARRMSGNPILVDIGAGYLVLQCMLISILSQWAPVPKWHAPRPPPLCATCWIRRRTLPSGGGW